jgi:hypothetical protein
MPEKDTAKRNTKEDDTKDEEEPRGVSSKPEKPNEPAVSKKVMDERTLRHGQMGLRTSEAINAAEGGPRGYSGLAPSDVATRWPASHLQEPVRPED